MTTPRIIRAIEDVAVALLRGRILTARTPEDGFSVGPYHEATQPSGELRFVLLAGGTPLVGAHVVPGPHAEEAGCDIGADWSAFGAARMFVGCVGAARAEGALRRAGIVPTTSRLAAVRQRGSLCPHGCTGMRRRFCVLCESERLRAWWSAT